MVKAAFLQCRELVASLHDSCSRMGREECLQHDQDFMWGWETNEVLWTQEHWEVIDQFQTKRHKQDWELEWWEKMGKQYIV